MVLHSDSGAQYTAHEFQAFLNMQGMISRMGSVGNGFDNAVADTFFGLLKRERIPRRCYLTRAEPIEKLHLLYESTLI